VENGNVKVIAAGVGCALLVLVAVLSAAGWSVSKRNSFVAMQQRADENWLQVENAYKQRAGLIAAFLQVEPGPAGPDREFSAAIAEAISQVGGEGGGTPEKIEAVRGLESLLSRMPAVLQRHPDLRSRPGFARFQDELSESENSTSTARRRFNQSVVEYNTAIQGMPGKWIASVAGFHKKNRFEVDGAR
jgi:LemA protein